MKDGAFGSAPSITGHWIVRLERKPMPILIQFDHAVNAREVANSNCIDERST